MNCLKMFSVYLLDDDDDDLEKRFYLNPYLQALSKPLVNVNR